MFGNMFGKIEEQQRELQQKLGSITAEVEVQGVKVIANANKEILNISINTNQLDLSDVEQLEDLLLTATNQALTAAGQKGAVETQKLLNDLLPGGMGGLGNLLGK